MNLSSFLPPELVAQGKEFITALKMLEKELSKGVQLDLTGFMNKPFTLPR